MVLIFPLAVCVTEGLTGLNVCPWSVAVTVTVIPAGRPEKLKAPVESVSADPVLPPPSVINTFCTTTPDTLPEMLKVQAALLVATNSGTVTLALVIVTTALAGLNALPCKDGTTV